MRRRARRDEHERDQRQQHHGKAEHDVPVAAGAREGQRAQSWRRSGRPVFPVMASPIALTSRRGSRHRDTRLNTPACQHRTAVLGRGEGQPDVAAANAGAVKSRRCDPDDRRWLAVDLQHLPNHRVVAVEPRLPVVVGKDDGRLIAIGEHTPAPGRRAERGEEVRPRPNVQRPAQPSASPPAPCP